MCLTISGLGILDLRIRRLEARATCFHQQSEARRRGRHRALQVFQPADSARPLARLGRGVWVAGRERSRLHAEEQRRARRDVQPFSRRTPIGIPTRFSSAFLRPQGLSGRRRSRSSRQRRFSARAIGFASFSTRSPRPTSFSAGTASQRGGESGQGDCSLNTGGASQGVGHRRHARRRWAKIATIDEGIGPIVPGAEGDPGAVAGNCGGGVAFGVIVGAFSMEERSRGPVAPENPAALAGR